MAAPTRFAEAEEHLLAAARAHTGLDDFGADDYLPGLRALLQAMDHDIHFTPVGREFGAGTVIGTLASRLHTQAGWNRYPGCLGMPLRQPLVITGIPRTGTTALHQLLSLDPQFQGLEHWLTDTPMPRPQREDWAGNRFYQSTAANIKSFYEAVPEMRAAHLIGADDVDECLEVLKQSFVSNRFCSGWPVPSYDAWYARQDERASYHRYADVLRLIGWGDERAWLLKNPGHIARLDVLLETFPDARVVQTHRNPVETLPSLCSVLAMSRRILEGHAVDTAAIGPRECRYWSDAVKTALFTRAQRPHQFFDVDHRRFHARPMSVVAELYEYFNLTLSATTDTAMRKWLADNGSSRNGTHRYSLEPYNLSSDDIQKRFHDYMLYFKL